MMTTRETAMATVRTISADDSDRNDRLQFSPERKLPVSSQTTIPLRPPAAGGGAAPVSGAPPAPVEFHFTQTESFPALLEQLGASLLVTTYQANKLLVLRARRGGLSILVRSFERPMGLAVDPTRI